ncbi:MAG: hypothetical protein RI516_01670 [Spiribacter sp.]|nr:hypothetical protein [Spiribacter sp.]MDR9480491.1 hypothetical protein [Spiribacter sp.]
MIKQILLTVVVTAIVILVVQARRRSAQVSQANQPPSSLSPQAIAGWVLVVLMVSAAVGALFLHNN